MLPHMGRYFTFKVVTVLNNAGNNEATTGLTSHLYRLCYALIGVNPAKKEEVIAWP